MADSFSAAELSRDFLLPSATDAPAPVVRLEGTAPSAPIACSAAIGVFDGVHRGHRDLLAHTVADARARGISAVAITFDPDPDVVLSRQPAPKLMTLRDRLRALAASGVDEVLVVPFTPQVAALDHQGFFDGLLKPYLAIRSLHVGADFRLGAGGASTVPVIAAWGRGRAMDVTGHDLTTSGNAPICATRIRTLLHDGQLDEANGELGRSYLGRGSVVRGRGQGTGMGFPTANVRRGERLCMPADGVYAGWALTGTTAWPAAINVGLPPMFADDPNSATLEATLLGFDGDLYGQELAVTFTRRLRPPIKFNSLGELIATVKRDMHTIEGELGRKGIKLGNQPEGRA